MRGAWCPALSVPRPPVLWSGQPGFCDPRVPGAVGAGVGTQHRPHSVRPCGPALRSVGVAEGRPRGGVPSTIVRGAWGQALSLSRLPAHCWAGCRGSLGVCGVCGVCAVRVVVRGAALPLVLLCFPLQCLGAVLCSPCARCVPSPVRAPCSSAGYPSAVFVGTIVGGRGAPRCCQPVGRRFRFDPCTPGWFSVGRLACGLFTVKWWLQLLCGWCAVVVAASWSAGLVWVPMRCCRWSYCRIPPV